MTTFLLWLFIYTIPGIIVAVIALAGTAIFPTPSSQGSPLRFVLYELAWIFGWPIMIYIMWRNTRKGAWKND
jgi:hypothetical protein